jgi:hypothetical protein
VVIQLEKEAFIIRGWRIELEGEFFGITSANFTLLVFLNLEIELRGATAEIDVLLLDVVDPDTGARHAQGLSNLLLPDFRVGDVLRRHELILVIVDLLPATHWIDPYRLDDVQGLLDKLKVITERLSRVRRFAGEQLT